jgi:hypothetical protein
MSAAGLLASLSQHQPSIPRYGFREQDVAIRSRLNARFFPERRAHREHYARDSVMAVTRGLIGYYSVTGSRAR